MHPIRQHILRKLILGPHLRYKDLKPDRIESNRFAYHLKSLGKDGYIKSLGGEYSLTAVGKRYIQRLSLASLKPRIQPAIMTLLVCRDKQNRYLLYERQRQPFFGKVGFPYGKIHLGETIAESAKRELKEKTGLTGGVIHRGDIYLFVYEKEALVTQMLAHVFEIIDFRGELIERTEVGNSFWGDVSKISKSQLIPGVLEVLACLKKKKYFFEEAVIKYHE